MKYPKMSCDRCGASIGVNSMSNHQRGKMCEVMTAKKLRKSQGLEPLNLIWSPIMEESKVPHQVDWADFKPGGPRVASKAEKKVWVEGWISIVVWSWAFAMTREVLIKVLSRGQQDLEFRNQLLGLRRMTTPGEIKRDICTIMVQLLDQ